MAKKAVEGSAFVLLWPLLVLCVGWEVAYDRTTGVARDARYAYPPHNEPTGQFPHGRGRSNLAVPFG
jgi:hypothetical protein